MSWKHPDEHLPSWSDLKRRVPTVQQIREWTRPHRRLLESVGFAVSAAVLVFLGGYLTYHFQWFPHSLLQRALRQADREATRMVSPPDFTATTDPDRAAGAGAARAGEVKPAVTMVVSSWPDFGWDPGIKLFDRQGNVLHQWRVRPTEVFDESQHRRGSRLAEQDIQGSWLLPDGDVVVNIEYAGAVRLDACSDVQWTLPRGNHHSLHRADDGSFWSPGISRAQPPRSERYPEGYPGLQPDAIYHPTILNFTADGEVRQVFRVLDLLYDNDLQRFIPKNRQHDRPDVVHMNDVEPLPADRADSYPLFEVGDLLVSLRNLDLVFVFDPETREVKWSASRPFIMQHDPDWMGNGWIGVFDNNRDWTERGTMLGGSRIVALRPHTGSSRVLFPTEESEHFYTAARGKWEQLPNGNRLLTESDEGRVLEVSPDGRTLWRWRMGAYSDDRVPSVTKGHRVKLSRRKIAAWPCSPGEKKD